MASFQCDQCGAVFSSENELREHTKTHMQPRAPEQHRCPACGETFTDEAQLKEHTKTHMQK